MSIISQHIASLLDSSKFCISFIDSFFKRFDIEGLLNECGGKKARGIPNIKILKFLVTLIFLGEISVNRALDNMPDAGISKNSVLRFLQNPKIDWIEFTTKLAIRVFNALVPDDLPDPLKIRLIVDDTAWPRARSKYVEALVYQKDHVKNTHYKGFRFQLVALFFGKIFLPLNCALVSSQKKEKLLAPVEKRDPGTPSAKREDLLFSSLLENLYYQIKEVLKCGLKPSIVLMDTWYSFPVVLYKLKEMGLDSVAALKNAKTLYLYKEEKLRVGEIFERVCPKGTKPDKDGILATVDVMAFYKDQSFPVRLVYAKNVNKSRDYFCIVSTDLTLDAPLIIAYYRYRFEIEAFFKLVKSPQIAMIKRTYSLNFDTMYATAAVAIIQVLILTVQRALEGVDSDSLIDQFYRTKAELEAAQTVNRMLSLARSIVDVLVEHYHLPREEAVQFIQSALARDKTFEAACSKLSKGNFDDLDLEDPESTK